MRAEGKHGAKKQLESINYDISSCEEQLKLIQRLKVPKEKRRELAEAKPLFQMTLIVVQLTKSVIALIVLYDMS